MIPVRSVSNRYFGKSGWESSAMNIVGTPWTAVHRSSWMARRTSSALKTGAGSTIAAPWVTLAMFESTIPKQW